MLMEEEGCAKIYWHLATSHTHISHLARKEVMIFLDIHSHPSAEILDAANHMTSNALSWRQTLRLYDLKSPYGGDKVL